jgi:hypothetical protein
VKNVEDVFEKVFDDEFKKPEPVKVEKKDLRKLGTTKRRR